MGRRVRIGSALAAATLAFVVVGTSTAHAILGTVAYKCQVAIAKESAKYFNGKLKLIQKCKNANIAAPGACLAPDPTALNKLVTKLNDGLGKKCDFDGASADGLARIGFPGPCPDPSGSGDGFTLDDLKACMLFSHDKALAGQCGGGTNHGQECVMLSDCPDQGAGTWCRGLTGIEYDSTVTTASGTALKCQEEVAKDSAKFVKTLLKSVQKCRNDLLNCKIVQKFGQEDQTVCKLSGLTPQSCRTLNEKTKSSVDKARDKALAGIESKCANPADVTALKLCEPDQATATDAATCEVQTHQDFADNPDALAISDLLDYEYAQPGVCGDNVKNQTSEECDGVDDAACPGQCGSFDSNFPCLCQTVKRTRVIEHANADLDNGWTGQSHDSGVVEGGGYVTDLWDCDGPGGPDTICNVGPSCSLPPNSPCNPNRDAINAAANADNVCAGLGQGTCRKTAGGATGPHCAIEFKKRCSVDGDCTSAGDHCVILYHGAPLPLSSGGVSVCVVNTFTEDVTGTTNLATGDSSIRLRQTSTTYNGGSLQQPCPVCGGFCSGPGGSTSPGVRNLCTTNADCLGGAICVTEPICSWGPNIDQKCRPNTPGGGATAFFGNPSVDCPIGTDQQVFGAINILFNPATTGAAAPLTANQPCQLSPASNPFNSKICIGGANQYAVCTNNTECPGSSCNLQCFCPAQSTTDSQRPNACNDACLGGVDDQSLCTADSDCTPPGFCHHGDCRLNPSDTDSTQEGQCSNGPFDLRCSEQTWLPCGGAHPLDPDQDCRAPVCPFCNPAGTETCNATPRNCFVSPTITRSGNTTGYVPVTHEERVTASTFCIAKTTSGSVNGVAGLPGPGAITQPTGSVESGF